MTEHGLLDFGITRCAFVMAQETLIKILGLSNTEKPINFASDDMNDTRQGKKSYGGADGARTRDLRRDRPAF